MSDDKSGSAPALSQQEIILPERYIHSDIWERLVEGPEDLTGIVAYGLYQIRKREWIAFHEKQHNCLPSEDQVKAYSNSQRSAAVQAYRKEAEGRLFQFGAEIVQSQLPEMQNEAFNQATTEAVEHLTDKIDALDTKIDDRTGYSHHIKTHVAGFIFLAGLIAVVTFAASFEMSPKEAAHKAMGLFKADPVPGQQPPKH